VGGDSLVGDAIGHPTRIGLIDDHAIFREGLRAVLSREPDLEVVGEAESWNEAVQLAERVGLDVALVDLVLPGLSGVSVTHALHRMQPNCRVLGLSMLDEPSRVAEMLGAGATGFALKSQPPAEIVEAIRTVRDHIRYLSPRVSHDQIDAIARDVLWPFDRLSRREREVFDLLIAGKSSPDIAKVLVISPRTVETHRQRVMEKLGVGSIVELVRLAARHGLLGE